jgi:hypothetical protein
MKTKISSPELIKLIEEVQNNLMEHPANLSSIKNALEKLLNYLTNPAGRTDVNCNETDTYFCLHDDNGFHWNHLPEDFQLILDDIGGQMHDTVQHPEMARNFESTPEQLLKRIRNLNINE